MTSNAHSGVASRFSVAFKFNVSPRAAVRALAPLGAVAGVLLLAACSSTPPADLGPYGSGASMGAGAQSVAMGEGQQFKFQADLSQRLQDALLKNPEAHALPMPRSDGFSQFRIDPAGFKPNSGELLPETLAALGEAVNVLKTSGACIVHVIGERHTKLPAGTQPGATLDNTIDRPIGSDIGERRSAAIAAEMQRLGFAAQRVRAESRVQPGSEGGVIIVIRPIVTGHEEEAYVPPPVEA